MSIDSIASSIQAYQTCASPFAPLTGTAASATTTVSGSLKSLSSDLQNVLLQLQSSGGKTTEAGNPTQAAPGVHHHHHGHTRQASAQAAPTGTPS